MAEKPKGGRGKLAPYESETVRVPKDIKRHCHQLADAYREYLEDGGDPADLPDLPPDIFRRKPHVEEGSFLGWGKPKPVQECYVIPPGCMLYELPKLLDDF
jgi:hypothetical protein